MRSEQTIDAGRKTNDERQYRDKEAVLFALRDVSPTSVGMKTVPVHDS